MKRFLLRKAACTHGGRIRLKTFSRIHKGVVVVRHTPWTRISSSPEAMTALKKMLRLPVKNPQTLHRDVSPISSVEQGTTSTTYERSLETLAGTLGNSWESSKLIGTLTLFIQCLHGTLTLFIQGPRQPRDAPGEAPIKTRCTHYCIVSACLL